MPVKIVRKKGTMDGSITETHPSFGVITWSRQQWGSNQAKLFQSPTSHHDVISLKIRRAELSRDLSRDWLYGKDEVVEVYLTTAQFAEFLTSPNRGDGTACTIAYTKEDGHIDLPTQESKYTQFKNEAAKDLAEIKEKMDEIKAQTETMLKGKTVKKGDVKAFESQVKSLEQHLLDNMPFLKEQFEKHMVDVVSHSKAEVEGYVAARLEEVGLAQLKKDGPKLLTDSPENDDVNP